MLKASIILILLVPKFTSAQYIHYVDNSMLKSIVSTVKPGNAPASVLESGSIKELPKEKIKAYTFTSVECPCQLASIPVLFNYISPAIVNKLKSTFDRHLYCITAIKDVDVPIRYRLRVCVKGEFKEVFANEFGDIVE